VDPDYDELLAAYPEQVRAKIGRFTRFARLCGVELEPFQALVMSEFFSGRRELICLLPRGNGKTTLFALVALWTMLTVKRGDVYVAASTARQATILWDEARMLAKHHPSIAKLVKFRHKTLSCEKTGGSITIVASDNKGRNHGITNGVLFLVDELHAHINSDTYIAFRTAMGKRADAQMVVISTAGMRLAGTLYDLRREALKFTVLTQVGALTHTLGPASRVALLEWALPQDVDAATVTATDLKRANPASFVTLDFLQEQLDAPGLRNEEVTCFHGNVWARVAKSWLASGAWAACAEPGADIPPGARGVWLGLDIGVYQDSSALVKLWQREDGRIVIKAKIWTPAGDGTPLDLTEVHQAVRQARHDHQVYALVMDRWNMEYQAQLLDAEGLLVLDHPMKDMASASQMIFEAINTQAIVHDGDETLAEHVAAARTVHTATGWKIAKVSRGVHDQIDALIALTIAHRTMKINGSTAASTAVIMI
jgi:phage terminase large subunit-like protein